MKIHGMVLVAAAVQTACTALSGGQAVEIRESDVAATSRWHGTLSTPQDLAGAVEMSGSAWMGPGEDANSTLVSVSIANATPGGVHPWEVRRGRCGADRGNFGSSVETEPLEVGSDGEASATATIPQVLPKSGDYFISIRASAQNRNLIVACGNLAPPVS
jgi:hypothetical protein